MLVDTYFDYASDIVFIAGQLLYVLVWMCPYYVSIAPNSYGWLLVSSSQ